MTVPLESDRRVASVWDAIEEHPVEAENLKVRAALTAELSAYIDQAGRRAVRMRRFRQDLGTDPWAANRQGMRLHRLARMDLAIITVTAVIFLCLSSFLAGAYTASNSLKFQNCFTAGTPCMDLGGEQRDHLRLYGTP